MAETQTSGSLLRRSFGCAQDDNVGYVEVITRPYTLHVSEAAASPNKLPACHHSHLKSSHPNSLQRCHPGSLQCCHPDRSGGISSCRQRLSPRLPVQKILRLRPERPCRLFRGNKKPQLLAQLAPRVARKEAFLRGNTPDIPGNIPPRAVDAKGETERARTFHHIVQILFVELLDPKWTMF